jgi:hypothetical protein
VAAKDKVEAPEGMECIGFVAVRCIPGHKATRRFGGHKANCKVYDSPARAKVCNPHQSYEVLPVFMPIPSFAKE